MSPILERVRKLLALAGSPNVHEAASAAAAAQALIVAHRLEGMLDAREAGSAADDITDGREAPLEKARRPRRWKVSLAVGLAEANGCIAYSALVGDETWLLLAGRAEDREAVAALWEWLVARLEWLSASHGAGRSRDWHEAFRIGAAEAVVARLAGAEIPAAASPDQEAALVRVQAVRASALEAWAERHLRLGPGRGMRVDARALEQGRAAGATLKLPR